MRVATSLAEVSTEIQRSCYSTTHVDLFDSAVDVKDSGAELFVRVRKVDEGSFTATVLYPNLVEDASVSFSGVPANVIASTALALLNAVA